VLSNTNMDAPHNIPTHLVDADTLAELLSLSPTTVREWARQKKIPSMKLSAKCVRYDPQEVLARIMLENVPGDDGGPEILA